MPGIFSKILDSFKNVANTNINAGNQSAIGIDIGTSSIKVVEIKKQGGKAMLETYGSIALGPYADLKLGAITNLPLEKITEALNEVLKQAGVNSKEVALSVPVQSSLVFSMELPVQINEKDLTSIVSTEARKYIPIPINEVSLDFFEIPKKELTFEEANNPDFIKEDSIKREVLVVAIQNDALEKIKSIASNSSLSSSFFEVEIFSAVRSCFEHELSLVVLIDFGASRVKISFVEFGVVKSYHTINRGSYDITSAISKSLSIPFERAESLKKEFGMYDNEIEQKLKDVIKVHTDYIFSEINNVLLRYEKKYSRSVTKIIFTGAGSLMKGFKEEAINNFKVEVQIATPFRKVGSPVFLEKVLDDIGPEFSVALGLALRKLQ